MALEEPSKQVVKPASVEVPPEIPKLAKDPEDLADKDVMIADPKKIELGKNAKANKAPLARYPTGLTLQELDRRE